MLKTEVSNLDEVPESLRHEYTQRDDGAFVLNISGPAPAGYATAADYAEVKSKHETSRNNNIALLKETADIAGVAEARDLSPVRNIVEKYRGVDVAEYEQLKNNAGKLAKRGVSKAEDIQALVVDAVAPLKAELEAERKARQVAQSKNDSAQLRGEISSAFLDAGGQPKALGFLTDRAEEVFEVIDGKVQAKVGNYSKQHAGEPVTVGEWMSDQTQDVKFAFGESHGGGAMPSVSVGNNSGARTLRDPSPHELGKHARAIADGTMKIVNS
jgi:hypothetical protein